MALNREPTGLAKQSREARRQNRKKTADLYYTQRNPKGLLIRRSLQVILIAINQMLPNDFQDVTLKIRCNGYSSICNFKNDVTSGPSQAVNLKINDKINLVKLIEEGYQLGEGLSILEVINKFEILRLAYKIIKENVDNKLDFTTAKTPPKAELIELTQKENNILKALSELIEEFDDMNIFHNINKKSKSDFFPSLKQLCEKYVNIESTNESETVSVQMEAVSSKRKQIEEESVSRSTKQKLNSTNETVSTSTFAIFADPSPNTIKDVVIKSEPSEDRMIDLEKVIDDLRLHLKTTLKDKRQSTNCGELVVNTLAALDLLIAGKECPKEDISNESTLNNNTTTFEKIFQIAEIKKEGENKYFSSIEHPVTGVDNIATKKGLNQGLPPREECYINVEENTEQTVINLNPSNVPSTMSNLANINNDLMNAAKECSGLVVGHVTLIGANKDTMDHVLTFCASSTSVFFIDGFFCKKDQNHREESKRDPIFTDLTTRIDDYTVIHKGKIIKSNFRDIFFLVHKKYPNTHVFTESNILSNSKDEEEQKTQKTQEVQHTPSILINDKPQNVALSASDLDFVNDLIIADYVPEEKNLVSDQKEVSLVQEENKNSDEVPYFTVVFQSPSVVRRKTRHERHQTPTQEEQDANWNHYVRRFKK